MKKFFRQISSAVYLIITDNRQAWNRILQLLKRRNSNARRPFKSISTDRT